MIFTFLLLSIPLNLVHISSQSLNDSPIKIAFGSCADLVKKNIDIFSTITAYNPSLFIWLGDFAYVDDKFLLLYSYLPDLATVAYRFNATNNHPSYQKMKSSFPVIGVWDDHDFGKNDGNKYNKNKEIIRQMYLDLFDEPKDSKRRTQAGLYFSYVISKNIKIILLDCRFNKDSWFEESQDMLGAEQWNWLEKEINDDEIELFFIGSGQQIMPDDRFLPESWFVKSKERLYFLIKKHGKRVILLSGDVHFGEIMKHPCSCQRIGYPLYEITSSGMTHYFGENLIIKDKLIKFVFPDTFSTHENRFFLYNFGTIEVFFDRKNNDNSKVVLQIRDIENNVKLEQIIYFKELEIGNKECEMMKEECVMDEAREKRFMKNVFVKLFDFDLYIYIVIVCSLAIVFSAIFCFFYLGKTFFRKISKVFKDKKD